MNYLIEVFWSEEDDGYIALIPDLPGCSAWGANIMEAVKEIEDAKEAWIEACRKSGEAVPKPKAVPRMLEAA